uniref:alpha/beta fold hydrolase n=1 Tax=Paractinoplanes polyasparticus TaxID=2856853 RepID=UPI001C840E4C|nr:alpha/beta hydrolase [Actinoplanes polyasparticus]
MTTAPSTSPSGSSRAHTTTEASTDERYVIGADGTMLFVSAKGPANAPVVVLVHGLGLSTRSWKPVIDRLAAAHRVVAYDLRGHGRSAPSPTNDYEVPAQAADLDAVLAATVRHDEQAVLVGHSLGGQIILARAQQRLDRIGAVVFAGSAGSRHTAPGLPGHRLPKLLRSAVRRLWLLTLQLAARGAIQLRAAERLTGAVARRTVFTPDDPAPAVREACREFLSTDPDVLARTALASVSDDGSRLAPHLHVPALILHGDHDKQVSEPAALTLLSRLPDSHLQTLPGAGHMLPMTNSGDVADHVARWVHHVAEPTAAPPLASTA